VGRFKSYLISSGLLGTFVLSLYFFGRLVGVVLSTRIPFRSYLPCGGT